MSRFVTELLLAFLTSGLFILYISKLQRFVSVIAKHHCNHIRVKAHAAWREH